MMHIAELIERYGKSRMTEVACLLGEKLEQIATEEEREGVLRCLYVLLQGRHYDESFGKCQVEKMYYTDKEGEKHRAPYWTEEEVQAVYSRVKKEIDAAYTFWDFYVVLNMTRSDHYPLLKTWFPDATENELDERVVEMAVCWLDDEDNPYGNEKAWGYFNGMKN